MRDGVVFTSNRIIAVNVQGITGRSKAPKELGANNASQFTANPVGAKLARESARPSLENSTLWKLGGHENVRSHLTTLAERFVPVLLHLASGVT
jgi:hypothetical protein